MARKEHPGYPSGEPRPHPVPPDATQPKPPALKATPLPKYVDHRTTGPLKET